MVCEDPDSGWINYGAYRVQSHDAKTASVMVSKGKHHDILMRKYFDRGEPCPIAVVAGMPGAVHGGRMEMLHRWTDCRRDPQRGGRSHQHA